MLELVNEGEAFFPIACCKPVSLPKKQKVKEGDVDW
jgi:hypothetical protein